MFGYICRHWPRYLGNDINEQFSYSTLHSRALDTRAPVPDAILVQPGSVYRLEGALNSAVPAQQAHRPRWEPPLGAMLPAQVRHPARGGDGVAVQVLLKW